MAHHSTAYRPNSWTGSKGHFWGVAAFFFNALTIRILYGCIDLNNCLVWQLAGTCVRCFPPFLFVFSDNGRRKEEGRGRGFRRKVGDCVYI